MREPNKIRIILTSLLAIAVGAAWLAYCVAVLVFELPDARLDQTGLVRVVTALVPVVLIGFVAKYSLDRARLRAQLDEQRSDMMELRSLHTELLKTGPSQDMAPKPAQSPDDADEPIVREAIEPSAEREDEEAPPPLAGIDSQPVAEAGTWLAELDMSASTLLRAMNLAEDERDVEGIRAVNVAMQSDRCASIIDLAISILQMLAERDLYLDDLPQMLVPASAWKSFAADFAASPIPNLAAPGAEREIDIVRDLADNQTTFRKISARFRAEAADFLRMVIPLMNDLEIEELVDSRVIRAVVLLEHAE